MHSSSGKPKKPKKPKKPEGRLAKGSGLFDEFAPDVLGAYLFGVSAAWGRPFALVAIADSDAKAGGNRAVSRLPDVEVLAAKGVRASPGCFRCLASARNLPSPYSQAVVSASVKCRGDGADRQVLVLPIANVHRAARYYVCCGCFAPGENAIHLRPPGSEGPDPGVPVFPKGAAAIGDAITGVRDAIQVPITAMCQHTEMLKEDEHHRIVSQLIRECLMSLVTCSDSHASVLGALARMDKVRAAADVSICCDYRGGGVLRHGELIVHRKRGTRPTASPKALPAYEVPFGGLIAAKWRTARDGFPLDGIARQEIRGDDPFAKYEAKLRSRIGRWDFAVLGPVSKRVPSGSCDVDPYCEYKDRCALFAGGAADEQVAPGSHRRRLVALNVLFVEVPMQENLAAMSLSQLSSLLRYHHIERRELEAVVLRGLPRLPLRDQRTHLRTLLDDYRAIADIHEKGKAFERFINGLLRLVPGWVPGEGHVVVKGSEGRKGAEIDVTVLIEPAEPRAQYWFSIFGPTVLVECKNYPNRKLGMSVNEDNPADVLMEKLSGVKGGLGLLVTSGEATDELRRYAREISGVDRAVVILDEDDIRKMVDSPGDIESVLKEKVANSVIVSGLTARTSRSGRAPAKPSRGGSRRRRSR